MFRLPSFMSSIIIITITTATIDEGTVTSRELWWCPGSAAFIGTTITTTIITTAIIGGTGRIDE
jgi:hypothetical protein